MKRKLAAGAGVLALLFVIFATLSPLPLRPTTSIGPGWEHVFAFCVIAFLFTLAFPRAWLKVAIVVAVIVVGLELAQHLVPGRHGRIFDASLKIVGTIVGIFLAQMLRQIRDRVRDHFTAAG